MGVLNARVCFIIILLLLTLSSSALVQAQNPFFVPPTYLGSGQTVTADFNGDGVPDLVSSNGTVLLGKGDGTFSVGTPISPGALIATADFNGDGKPDLVLASSSTNTFSVLLGKGDGTFQAPIVTSVASPLTFLIVGDLNGDGKPDLLGLPSLSTVLVAYLGKGDGTFAAGVNSGGQSVGVLGDFNGDHKLDLAFSVGVQLGNGDGTFQPPLPFTAGPFAGSVYEAVGDFNGDGKLDLAISEFGAHTQVLLGKGDGTFQPALQVGVYGGAVAAADLNHDGKADLVVDSYPFVQTFLSNGDGTFQSPSSYNVVGPFSTDIPLSLVVDDFNKDGKLDVAANNTMLLGNGDGTLQGDPCIPGLSGDGVPADFNKDGHTDLALIGAINVATDTAAVEIFLNDGKGGLLLAHTYAIPVPNGAATGADIAAAVDLNGDGNLDLVSVSQSAGPGSSSWTLTTMLGNGDGSFQAPATLAGIGPGQVTGLTVADLRSDKKPDIIAIANGSMFVFVGNGDGTFAAPVQYFVGSNGGVNVVAADFNKDGKMDVAVGTYNGIELLLGNGDGTFQPATNIPAFPNPGDFRFLVAVDINGDGNADLVAQGNNTILVLLGNGDGTFTPLPSAPGLKTSAATSAYQGTGAKLATTVSTRPDAAKRSLVARSRRIALSANNAFNTPLFVADFNGDGKLDFLGRSPQLLEVFLGNGDGTFGAPLTLVPASGSVFVADFNGDGRPDIGFDNFGNELAWLYNHAAPPAPDFLITASALSPIVVKPGNTATSSITLTAIGGFGGAVTLSCAGLPSGVNCSFSPSSLMNGSGTSALMIGTGASTPVGTYPVLIVGTSSAIIHERVITLTVATSAGATTASLAPETLTFAQQASGTTSAAQSVTLTNTGNAQLVISGIAAGGTNPGDFKQTNTCGSSLAEGASCQISVTFSPAGMGSRSAAISISDNATGSPQMVTLAGSGPDFSLAASGSGATATVKAGQTATYTISVVPGGGFNQSVTLTCSGAPAKSMCSLSPNTISLNGTSATTAMVTVSTTASSQGFPPIGFDTRRITYRPLPFALALLGVMLVVGLYLRRKDQRLRWAPALALGILVCTGMTITSCGGGSSGGTGGGGSTGTPTGSYTITVSASAMSGSATLAHATQLTLVVQ